MNTKADTDSYICEAMECKYVILLPFYYHL